MIPEWSSPPDPRLVRLCAVFIALSLLALPLLAAAPSTAPRAPWLDAAPPMRESPSLAQAPAHGDFGLPALGFVRNDGQLANSQVHYYLRTPGMDIGFGTSAFTYLLSPRPAYPMADEPAEIRLAPAPAAALRLTFEGSRPSWPVGSDPLPGVSHFLVGREPAGWHAGVPHFAHLTYFDLYDGMDAVFSRAGGGAVKYDLHVAAGADLSSFVVRVEGAERLALGPDGGLAFHTVAGAVQEGAPVGFQDGREIPCAFILRSGASFGFACPDRDPTLPLVVDPLVWATYLSGSIADTASGLVIGPDGEVYLAGVAYSPDFPTTPGAFRETETPSSNGFICKLDPTGTQLVFSTFFGGDADDVPQDVAVDTAGSAYAVGWTNSTDFPLSSGAFDNTSEGSTEGFVFKLSPDGAAMAYSTLAGGLLYETFYDIAVRPSGNAVIVGYTGSPDFPSTPGAYSDHYLGGIRDIVVFEISPDARALVFGTYLGGTREEKAYHLDLGTSGEIYLVGYTNSSDFPTTVGAHDRTYNGGILWGDTFAAKLSADGSSLLFATYLGGSGDDCRGCSLALDGDGGLLVSGETTSADFPVTAGAYDVLFEGGSEGFLARLGQDTGELLFATFVGAENDDRATEVTTDSGGHAFVTGETDSTLLPSTAGAVQSSLNGTRDGFLVEFDLTGTRVLYATYFGGRGDEFAWPVAVREPDPATVEVTFAGITTSSGLQGTESGYANGSNASFWSAYVARLTFVNLRPVAALGVDPHFAMTSHAVAFNASGSSDPEDDLAALAFRFDFDGDGSWDTAWGPNATVAFSFAAAGAFGPRVEVRDTGGLKDISVADVRVVDPLAVTASPAAARGYAPLSVNFTGRTAGGLEPIGSWWDFGQGPSPTPASIEHTFSEVGDIDAIYTALDALGVNASAHVLVQVAAPLSLTVTALTPVLEEPGTAVFLANVSGGRGTVLISWDTTQEDAVGRNGAERFDAPGNYTVFAHATDEWGTRVTASAEVRVFETPRVSIRFTPAQARAPANISFEGLVEGGTAPYSYAWTLSDGGELSGVGGSHLFATAGSYNVTLRVTEATGKSNATTVTVVVLPPPLPTAATSDPFGAMLWLVLPAAAALLLVLLARRRRSEPPE